MGETAIGYWAKQRVALGHLALGRNSDWQLKEKGATAQYLADDENR